MANGMLLDRPTIPRLLFHRGSIERTREEREKRREEDDAPVWPNRLWILMDSIGVLEYSFAISNIFHGRFVIYPAQDTLS